ncbi:MAG: hypothetical protein Sylvanvirus12_15 [Sylvanvirus sp.]|uniref:Uncharacterized protein n=1 Tax=Sylvanvirus sp. TaxID=2487774 RepID=A0A3G5AKP2_9VIRU|nr:MAG: hypothetical protein Sylvanvirus12_15 [Sylvanvirus sp.]
MNRVNTSNPYDEQAAYKQYLQEKKSKQGEQDLYMEYLQYKKNQQMSEQKKNPNQKQPLSQRYASHELPKGVYPPDVVNPPTRLGGVTRMIEASYEPSETASKAFNASKSSSRTYKNVNSLGAASHLSQSYTVEPEHVIQEGRAIPAPKAYPREVTRRSTTQQYNIQELKSNAAFEGGSYDQGYFQRPLLGHIPQNAEEQFMETQAEKRCRCSLHIQGKALKDVMDVYQQALQVQKQGRYQGIVSQVSQDDVKKALARFQRMPYARCNVQSRGKIQQLQQQGLDVIGKPIGACGENLNFDDSTSTIPTEELYAFAFSKKNTKIHASFFESLPPYSSDPQELEKLRPELLQLLRTWQTEKDQGRQEMHYRKCN